MAELARRVRALSPERLALLDRRLRARVRPHGGAGEPGSRPPAPVPARAPAASVPRPAPVTVAEAAGALENLAALSDADVEHLLGRVLDPADEPDPAAGGAGADDELVDVASTLGRLDDLADYQVDALLARLMEQRDG
jgi:hypothetical protein